MAEKARIQLRAMQPSDGQLITEIDHSYHTEQVWQMELVRQGDVTGVAFKQVRLPRSMRVEYPRTPGEFIAPAAGENEVYVSLVGDEVAGYIHLDMRQAAGGVWVRDLAVRRRFRRQGIATAMIVRAQKSALERGCRRVFIEMQSKNYPGICLAGKLGFEFSGFTDQYYENQDIAVFFTRRL